MVLEYMDQSLVAFLVKGLVAEMFQIFRHPTLTVIVVTKTMTNLKELVAVALIAMTTLLTAATISIRISLKFVMELTTIATVKLTKVAQHQRRLQHLSQLLQVAAVNRKIPIVGRMGIKANRVVI
jgi:hypothetical protein